MKSVRLPPPYPEMSTIVLLGKRVQLKNIIGDIILNTKKAFITISDDFEWKTKKKFKIIKTPNFFDEKCPMPDQQIIDLMALSAPGPKLFILAIDAENAQEEKIISQIRQLENIFGEEITKNLGVTLPDIESLQSLRYLKEKFGIQLTTANENLATECEKWCSGLQPFMYDYENYIKKTLNRRKTTLEKRSGDGSPSHNCCKAVSTQPSGMTEENKPGDSDQTNHHQSEPQKQQSDCSANGNITFNVVLLGETGTGKSKSANTILAAVNSKRLEHFKSEASSLPVTICCKEISAQLPSGITVRVVDTPDLFYNDLQNPEEEIRKCKEYCQSEPGIILLVLQLSRLTDGEKEILKNLEQKLDCEIREKTIVLFTHGDDLQKEQNSLEEFIKERDPLKNLVDLCGSRYHVFNNKLKDTKQVMELFQKIPNHENYFPNCKKKMFHRDCSVC